MMQIAYFFKDRGCARLREWACTGIPVALRRAILGSSINNEGRLLSGSLGPSIPSGMQK